MSEFDERDLGILEGSKVSRMSGRDGQEETWKIRREAAKQIRQLRQQLAEARREAMELACSLLENEFGQVLTGDAAAAGIRAEFAERGWRNDR